MSDAKIFKQDYRFDIALDEGVGPWMVVGVSGLMVFFVTLALACNFALSALTADWVGALANSVTVEMPASAPPKDVAVAVKKLTALAGQHPAVEAARALSDTEVRKLVEPWLGSSLPAEMPMPALVEIAVVPGADTAKLKSDIEKIAPGAAIDTHSAMLQDITTLANTARLFVLLLTLVITGLGIVSIAGIVRAKFSIHRQEVETLHYIGASDEYIARQFRVYMLTSALKGAVGGLMFMLLALLAVGWATKTVDETLLPALDLLPLQWIVTIVSPVVIGSLIAHFTAQRAVMGELAKMP